MACNIQSVSYISEQHSYATLKFVFFLKKSGPTPASFLFIFVLFKHNFTEKTVGFSGIRTRVVRVEGEQADYLTTIRALKFVYHIVTNSLSGTCLPLQCSCRRLVFIASAQRSKNCFKRNVFLIGIQSYSHFQSVRNGHLLIHLHPYFTR